MSYPRVLCALLIVSAVVVVGLSRFIGWNSSPSAAPVGFYWRSKPALKRGQLVEVCLPHGWAKFAIDRGYIGYSSLCADGSQPLIKIVRGLPGDTLWIDPATVMKTDTPGRPMPHAFGMQHLGPGQIWLYGAAPKSFDSRYFNSIPTANVIADMTPLWTWGSK